MLSDPQSITYATVAKTLAATGRNATSSTYYLQDGTNANYLLTISHSATKSGRNRAVVRLERDSVVVNPLIPAQNVAAGMTCTLTIDFPTLGLVAADAQNLGNALVAWATSSTLLRVINGET